MYNKVFTKLLWHRRRNHDFGIMAFLRQLKITTDLGLGLISRLKPRLQLPPKKHKSTPRLEAKR
jgi:hypothetical protein